MNKKTKAMLLMIVCAVLWSTAGIFIKLISWNPFIISGLRGLISAAVLAIYMESQGIHIKVQRNSIMAAIGLGGSATLFTVANKLTTASAIIHVFGFTTCNNAAARAVNRTWRLEERFAAGALNSCQLIQESHSTPAQLIT